MRDHGINRHWALAASAWLMATLLGCQGMTSDPQTRGKKRSTGETIERIDEVLSQPEAPPPMSAAESEVRGHLNPMAARLGDGKVLFVDCEAPPCMARIEAESLGSLKQFLQAISQEYQGRIGFTAREHFQSYTGRRFQADVVMNTDQIRPVPTNETELTAGN
jgi:hypothetical protein